MALPSSSCLCVLQSHSWLPHFSHEVCWEIPLALALPSENNYDSLALFLGAGGLHCVACGILVPRPGIEPGSEAWSPNHWTAREFLLYTFLTSTATTPWATLHRPWPGWTPLTSEVDSPSTLVSFSLHSSQQTNGFFFLKFFLIFGCVGSSLLRAGFLYLRRAGATVHCGARASHRCGFSCCGARVLGARASAVVARGLSSCGTRT